MAGRLTRRDAIKVAGIGTLSLTAARLGIPTVAGASPDCTPRTAGWLSAGTLLTRERGSDDPAEQVLWTTLMRVDTPDKLGSAALDSWYLWFWTHDAPICRLYVAPQPTGPFRPYDGTASDGRVAVPAVRQYPSPPYPQELLFRRDHFSSGDIVWDPETRYFYATPHSVRTTILRQAAFMIRSRDGIAWEYVDGGLVHPDGTVYAGLVLYPNNGFDTNHVGYGRFLRDVHGNLVRHEGEIVHYYRGQNGSKHATSVFKAGIATAPGPGMALTRRNRGVGIEAFDPAGGREFVFGSALKVGDDVHLIMEVTDFGYGITAGSVTVLPPVTMYRKRPRKRADGSDDPLAWDDGSGEAFYASATLPDGGSFACDDDGTQYMTTRIYLGSPGTPTAQQGVELLRAPAN